MMKNQEPGELIEKQYIHLNIQNTTLNENSRSVDLGTREWYNRMVQEKSSWKEKHCNWNKKKKTRKLFHTFWVWLFIQIIWPLKRIWLGVREPGRS